VVRVLDLRDLLKRTLFDDWCIVGLGDAVLDRLVARARSPLVPHHRRERAGMVEPTAAPHANTPRATPHDRASFSA